MTKLFQDVQNRFFQVLDELPQNTRSTLQEAYELAEKEHEGQTRKAHRERPDELDPYLIHPLRVSLILMQELGLLDRTALVSAVLHDVIEDGVTRPSVSDIGIKFGEEIAATVLLLSKPDEFNTGTHDPALLKPYHESFFSAPLHVRLVKLSDRLDNLREILLVDRRKFQLRYLTETRDVYLPLAEQTSKMLFGELKLKCMQLEELLQATSA